MHLCFGRTAASEKKGDLFKLWFTLVCKFDTTWNRLCIDHCSCCSFRELCKMHMWLVHRSWPAHTAHVWMRASAYFALVSCCPPHDDDGDDGWLLPWYFVQFSQQQKTCGSQCSRIDVRTVNDKRFACSITNMRTHIVAKEPHALPIWHRIRPVEQTLPKLWIWIRSYFQETSTNPPKRKTTNSQQQQRRRERA